MAETFGGSDAEGNWLWKDAYEALEIDQILLIQQQGRELLNQSNRRAILQGIEQIHQLCPTVVVMNPPFSASPRIMS
jgi:hypothetical protein